MLSVWERIERKNKLKFFKSQRIARLSDVPPVECHQALRTSVEHHNEAFIVTLSRKNIVALLAGFS